MMRVCRIENCDRAHKSRGYCNMHYQRLTTHGDPLTTTKRANGGCNYVSKRGYKIGSDSEGRERPEHVIIATRALGHALPPGAIVHHADRNRLNNDPTNLVICPDQAYHFLLHQRMRAMDVCGHADWRICEYCKRYDDPKNMSISRGHSRHRTCHSNAVRRK